VQLPRDFDDLLAAFESVAVDYVVVGGYAVVVHALLRATKDIDLVRRADSANLMRASRALAACIRTLILIFLSESARSRLWPHLKYAGYSRFGRLEIVPIARKNPSARFRKQAAS
jgi:hypothetical protein